jgi:hypothetical protein
VVYLLVTTAFQDMKRAGHVRLDIDMRIFGCVPNAGLCGQMNDPFGPVLIEYALHEFAVRKVAGDVPIGFMRLEKLESIDLESGIVVRVEVVQPDYRVSFSEQSPGHVSADETG